MVSNIHKIKLSIDGATPTLNINLTLVCEKEETYDNENITELAKANKVSNDALKELERYLTQVIKELVSISVNSNCDFLQITEMLYRHQPNRYFEFKDTILQKIKLSVKVTCKNYR